MAKKHIVGVAVLAASALMLAGCASSETPSDTEGEITGEITVLTQRTDIVDTIFKDYAATFEAKYPGTTVKFEAIKDYENDVSTRLSSGNYGDVALIPGTVTKAQLSQFFEPLGTVEEMSKTYRFSTEKAFDGQSYGVSITGNTQGLVYNKNVWADAGITELPTTPEEFLDDLQAIKDSTDAIPLYTNYHDGWPLTQWEGNRAVTGDAEASNELVQDSSPWDEGKYHYVADGLLFDAVAAGLTEDDPTTTEWEGSKAMIGSGEVATMLLGSWAITQMQEAAVTAGGTAEDIGYMPFPWQQDGVFNATVGGDYQNAINVNSDNKATARAWIEWFAAESGYAFDQGGISPLVDGPNPTSLQDFTDAGVVFVELSPPAAGTETYENDIVNESEIDLWGPLYRQKLVDIARGAADGTKESYFAELNQRWGDAQASIVG